MAASGATLPQSVTRHIADKVGRRAAEWQSAPDAAPVPGAWRCNRRLHRSCMACAFDRKPRWAGAARLAPPPPPPLGILLCKCLALLGSPRSTPGAAV